MKTTKKEAILTAVLSQYGMQRYLNGDGIELFAADIDAIIDGAIASVQPAQEDAQAGPGGFGQKVTEIIGEIRKAKTLAWRDSLIENLLELIEPEPGDTTPSVQGESIDSERATMESACAQHYPAGGYTHTSIMMRLSSERDAYRKGWQDSARLARTAAPRNFKLMSPSEILAEQKKMIDAGTYDVVRLAQYVEARTLKASQAAPSEGLAIPTVSLTGNQLRAALDIINPDGPSDELQCDDELTFGVVNHTDDSGAVARGMCCWNGDTDGVIPLDDVYRAPATEQAKPELDRLAHRESLWVALLDAANAYLAADPEQGIMIGLHDKQTFLGLGTKAQFTSMCDGRSGLQREEERHDRVRLIELLEQIKPNYGDVGSRDCEVTAQRKRIEDAIVILSAQPVPQASGERDAARCKKCSGQGLIGFLTSVRCDACEGTGRAATTSKPEGKTA